VFLPLSFLSGITGAFSKALAVTMGVTLVISYLMAAFVVPVLARRFIDSGTGTIPMLDVQAGSPANTRAG